MAEWHYKDETGRVCSGPCKTYKPWEEFNRNLAKPTGYRSECKSCQSKKAKQRYQDKKGTKK